MVRHVEICTIVIDNESFHYSRDHWHSQKNPNHQHISWLGPVSKTNFSVRWLSEICPFQFFLHWIVKQLKWLLLLKLHNQLGDSVKQTFYDVPVLQISNMHLEASDSSNSALDHVFKEKYLLIVDDMFVVP